MYRKFGPGLISYMRVKMKNILDFCYTDQSIQTLKNNRITIKEAEQVDGHYRLCEVFLHFSHDSHVL